MPGSFSLTVGTNTSTVPISLTNAQINALIRRYCVAKDINIAGKSATEIGEIVLRRMLAEAREASVNVQREEGLAMLRTSLEAQITSDNDL